MPHTTHTTTRNQSTHTEQSTHYTCTHTHMHTNAHTHTRTQTNNTAEHTPHTTHAHTHTHTQTNNTAEHTSQCHLRFSHNTHNLHTQHKTIHTDLLYAIASWQIQQVAANMQWCDMYTKWKLHRSLWKWCNRQHLVHMLHMLTHHNTLPARHRESWRGKVTIHCTLHDYITKREC